MPKQRQNASVCSNGHPQPAGGSRFCIYCGIPVTQTANQPAAPPPLYNPNIPPPPPYPQYAQLAPPVDCMTCGGAGQGLTDKKIICDECNWLRPLVPGYHLENHAFEWAADAKAMAALRAIKPLNAAAKKVSEKVGRKWIEAAFNGVLLGENQLPQIYGQAVRAARILGMSHMPDVYLSGDRAWDCLTFGTDRDYFVVVGSALAGNFQGVDMLYMLAREMGHCKAGHALWKTVIRFFLGEQGPAKGFMAGGILNAILSPTEMIGGAMEMPLLAWARQAEITADRAGLLAVGSEEIARRVLLSWSLKSSFMFKQLNIDAWLEQQEEDDGDMVRLSELTTSSTPYLGPRLKLLKQFSRSQEFQDSVVYIRTTLSHAAPPKPQPAKKQVTAPPSELKIKCSTCQAPMRVPMSALVGKNKLSVKCPNAKCGKVTVVQKKIKPAGSNIPAAKPKEEIQNYGE
ncbi:MAG: M48 family metallopeptidase [Acidobacteriota bacterium]